LPNSGNRALGLLATSSTGPTAFGARFINETAASLTSISLQVTGELWRQSDLPKTLAFYYFIDPSATNLFSTNYTARVPALNVSFPIAPADVGGLAVDGTSPANQVSLNVLGLLITNWAPGAALWLVWEMADATGKAQGLAIDNLSFSASNQSGATTIPVGIQMSGTNVLLSWSSATGQTYQIEYKDDLNSPVWLSLGNPIAGTGSLTTITTPANGSAQRFFRLQVLP